MQKSVHDVDSMECSPTSSPSRDGAQSIRRSALILRLVAVGGSAGRGLQDIAIAADLSRPTTHRILSALLMEGLIEQHPRSRRYIIGEQISLLAFARSRRPALMDAAEAFVDTIAREIGDTTFLTVRTGDDTLCLARRLGTYPIQVLAIDVGVRRPLGVSAAGTAIIAAMSEEEAHQIIRRNAHRFINYKTDEARVAQRVLETRKRGYALSDPGVVPGTKALSVSINGGSGVPIGALTVAAVRQRMRPQREAEIKECLSSRVSQIAVTSTY